MSDQSFHSRLRHVYTPGLIQHITFRLADSMPANLRAEWKNMIVGQELNSQRDRIQRYLDAGYGDCLLLQPVAAKITEQLLRDGDGNRYRLLAWVVMPNHVHVLIRASVEWSVDRVVQDWKRFSALMMNKELERQGPVWHRDYYDRFMRSDKQLLYTTCYIHNNPVTVGLVQTPADWLYGSARLVPTIDTTLHPAWEE